MAQGQSITVEFTDAQTGRYHLIMVDNHGTGDVDYYHRSAPDYITSEDWTEYANGTMQSMDEVEARIERSLIRFNSTGVERTDSELL